MTSSLAPPEPYRLLLSELDDATRSLAADTGPREHELKKRDTAIAELAVLGVPRAVIGKLTGLTRARVQQILERHETGVPTGDAWQDDPVLQRLIEYAILERPVPSIGIGIRRESVVGPHIGAGFGAQVRLTGDLDHNRSEVIVALTKLLEQTERGDFDGVLELSDEELSIVRGSPLAS